MEAVEKRAKRNILAGTPEDYENEFEHGS